MVAVVRNRILDLLSDCKPRCVREIADSLHVPRKLADDTLYRGCMCGPFLRSERPFRERFESLQGRRGLVQNTRSFYLYTIHSDLAKEVDGIKFVTYHKAECKVNKARLILDFLRNKNDKAFYSKQISDALKEYGVRPWDIMPNLRRYERKGWILIRGYRGHEREPPFSAGYVVTWLDAEMERSQAIKEALQKTENLLMGETTCNPTANRIRLIRDTVISGALQKDIVSLEVEKWKQGRMERLVLCDHCNEVWW